MYSEIDPEADEIAYSFSLLSRIFFGGFGLGFLSLCLYLTWIIATGEYETDATDILLIGGFPLSALFFWAAGPRDIVIDMQTRRYRLRQGWPLIARWQTGDVNDIAGLYVRRNRNQGRELYLLLVEWYVPGRRDTTLGIYADGDLAWSHARHLGRRLDVEVADVIRGQPAMQKPTARGMVVSRAVPFGFISLLCLALGLPGFLQEDALKTRGQEVVGIVTNVSARSSKGVRTIYCDYTINGIRQSKHYRVRIGADRLPQKGDMLRVTYLPEDPEVSQLTHLESRSPAYLGVTTGIIAALCSIGCSVAAGWLWWRSRS